MNISKSDRMDAVDYRTNNLIGEIVQQEMA